MIRQQTCPLIFQYINTVHNAESRTNQRSSGSYLSSRQIISGRDRSNNVKLIWRCLCAKLQRQIVWSLQRDSSFWSPSTATSAANTVVSTVITVWFYGKELCILYGWYCSLNTHIWRSYKAHFLLSFLSTITDGASCKNRCSMNKQSQVVSIHDFPPFMTLDGKYRVCVWKLELAGWDSGLDLEWKLIEGVFIHHQCLI